MGHTHWGRQIEVGYVQTAIFDQYRAISQKRCKIGTWLLWNANMNSYVLYRLVLFPVALSDPNYTKPRPPLAVLFWQAGSQFVAVLDRLFQRLLYASSGA